MYIVPVTNLSINWGQYLQIMKQILARSVSKGLDASGLEISNDENGLKSFLLTLSEFRNPDGDARSVLKDAGEILKHLHFGFLFITNDPSVFAELAFSSPLKILPNDRVALVSANMEEWRTAVINGNNNSTLRIFYNQVLKYFESIGLGQLWFYYKKSYLADQTFLLELKP